MYMHGMTFGGHPVQAAVALKNIEIMRRDRIVERVRETRGRLPRRARAAARAADRRRPARRRLFYALELVRTGDARELQDEECDELLRGFVSPRLFERGLICRADDRGDPVVQLSPPLVAGPAGVRQDRRHARRRADRSLEAHLVVTERRLVAACR